MNKILEVNKVLYLESKDYSGKSWKVKSECKYFSNRKVMPNELPLDFDDLKDFWGSYAKISKYFINKGYLFWIYQSGISGIHLHFFAYDITNKYQKKELILMIEKDLGIKIDYAPAYKGWIRAEDSVHPVKKFKKILLFTNVHPVAYLDKRFYFNRLSVSITKKLSKMSFSEPTIDNIPVEKDKPRSIKFMQNNTFANGRKRILFCLISWWKSRGLSDAQVFSKSKDWINRQNYFISDLSIKASINSSNGTVRDKYRLELLEELGFSVESLTVKMDLNVEITRTGF